jgi:hypothetical protein
LAQLCRDLADAGEIPQNVTGTKECW